MLGNYLATALSNLARNWLYAAISIFGLAVSFAGAILVAQFVRNEFSYDRWIPGYEYVYKLMSTSPARYPAYGDVVHGYAAKELKEAHPGVIATTRLMQAFPVILQNPIPAMAARSTSTSPGPIPNSSGCSRCRRWRAISKTALDQPDTVVMTEKRGEALFRPRRRAGPDADHG